MQNSYAVLVVVLVLFCIDYLTVAEHYAQSGVITRSEALEGAFPGADFELERLFLTKEQVKRIEELSRVKVASKLYLRFVATRGETEVGRIYADTHRVRSKRETLLISLNLDSSIHRIDVVAFNEPLQYLPSERWLKQYDSKVAGDPDVDLGRAVRVIQGATLTARAVNEAVKRIQAMDIVLKGESI